MMKPKPNDYTLAKRARDGDKTALAELIEILRKPFFGMAYAELRHFEDAQDAVSAAILRICHSIDTLYQPESFRQWANSIARNEVHRIFQRRKSDLSIEEFDGIETDIGDVEAQVMQFTILTTMPVILLSGFIVPCETLPGPLYLISDVLPVTHFISICRGIVVRGATVPDILPYLYSLLIITQC